ncbi:MGH1-like glycoside hydrolase domain-containing protein [Rubritalea sp.]|uniref:MGH1-like glycoside hydrolase domain-containing protein n=1 Tax=Rubritalea sp. TaxID=2109375 RepID=UPI003EF263D2
MITEHERNTPERVRLAEEASLEKNWKRWGPYLAERQWGTVREDYSEGGDAWNYFTHDQSRRRAYRWGEDGLLGWCDRKSRINFAPVLWNGKDSILKERLFGLSGTQGNHGEDVKECYYYLNSTPTHSYTRALYKYPMGSYPYEDLVDTNRGRGPEEAEYGIEDTGAFEDEKYWDVETTVAKETPSDMCWRLRLTNNSSEEQLIHILPSVWLRNSWAWGDNHFESDWEKPSIKLDGDRLVIEHCDMGKFHFYIDAEEEAPVEWLFTENDSNLKELFGQKNKAKYTKDAFHEYLINVRKDVVNPAMEGTKAAAWMKVRVPAGETFEVRCRLIAVEEDHGQRFEDFDGVIEKRKTEERDFYDFMLPVGLGEEERRVAVQGYAGLLWSKQFYYYVVKAWLHGDNGEENATASRLTGRNKDWRHMFARDVLSMPDKWEYPWFACWDSAFHMVAFARLDPDFAKKQLLLFLREWYLHPNGQIPAYEWSFSDVNPPVHAWAVWEVHQILERNGIADLDWLERAVQKLCLNFTWWVNRKDHDGNHLFSGGFLGLDNIGVFDRSQELGDGARLLQADGTAWMGGFCSQMLEMCIKLAATRPAYEDMASKFFEHFIRIARAMNEEDGRGLWCEEDGFYYDHLVLKSGQKIPLKVRSMVGLLTMMGVAEIDMKQVDKMPGFKKRLNWFIENRPDLAEYTTYCDKQRDDKESRLLMLPLKERFEKLLVRMLDEDEFLSDYGLRSLSKYHKENPYGIVWKGEEHTVSYVPGESNGYMFGGNSNWRGPIWFPVNYIIISSLRKYQHFYGNNFQVEFPTGSGNMLSLGEVADQISDRLVGMFLPGEDRSRPCLSSSESYSKGEKWGELVLFYEYFHGDTGQGLGASHQTGWTALVVTLMRYRAKQLAEEAKA